MAVSGTRHLHRNWKMYFYKIIKSFVFWNILAPLFKIEIPLRINHNHPESNEKTKQTSSVNYKTVDINQKKPIVYRIDRSSPEGISLIIQIKKNSFAIFLITWCKRINTHGDLNAQHQGEKKRERWVISKAHEEKKESYYTLDSLLSGLRITCNFFNFAEKYLMHGRQYIWAHESRKFLK